MQENITETTLKVYRSLGYSEKDVWEMFDRIAQKHGFRNYGETNDVLISLKVKNSVKDPLLVERVLCCKEKSGMSFRDMVNEINTLSGCRVVSYKYFTTIFGERKKKTDEYNPHFYEAVINFLLKKGC